MDGNKDAAQKCLRIGKESLEAGDRVRAFRFLTKAQRLDPSLDVDDLLSSVGEEGDGGRKDPAPSPNSAEKPIRGDGAAPSPNSAEKPIRGDGAAPSSAKPSFRGKEASSSGDNSRCYTEEQVSIVRKIKKERDYYQILGLERSCSEEDVRKAYRKLSLKVHPDKNKAPGAEEAFKLVSKAFQCLNNEETRKRYDLVGSEEPLHQFNKHTTRHAAYGYNGFYEADIDAEEIFRNFFFGGMAPATTQFGQFRFRTGGMGGARAHNEHRLSNSNLRMLLQLLPIIVLILINFIPSSDPPYALSPTYVHEQRLVTSRGVPFYVKQGKFEQQYPRNSAERLQLEDRVEREYVSIVSQNCRLEVQRRQWGFTNEAPHCDMLQKYKAAVDAEA